jgi:hypothetical protein
VPAGPAYLLASCASWYLLFSSFITVNVLHREFMSDLTCQMLCSQLGGACMGKTFLLAWLTGSSTLVTYSLSLACSGTRELMLLPSRSSG